MAKRETRVDAITKGLDEVKAAIREETASLRAELRAVETGLRGEMTAGFTQLRSEMHTQFMWLLGGIGSATIALLIAIFARG